MSEEAKNPIVEQLNQSLSETLAFIKDTSGTAIDFAKEQTPLYVKELLFYDFTYSLIWFCLGLIFAVVALVALYNLYKHGKNNWQVPALYRNYGRDIIISNPSKEDWENARDPDNQQYTFTTPEDNIAVNVIVAVVFSILTIMFVYNNMEWVKIKLAPRVYMVEKIKEILK